MTAVLMLVAALVYLVPFLFAALVVLLLLGFAIVAGKFSTPQRQPGPLRSRACQKAATADSFPSPSHRVRIVSFPQR